MKRLLLSLLLLAFFGCAKPQTWHEYKVKKGKHRFIGNKELIVTTFDMAYLIRFDKSCLYDELKYGCEGDWNKLFGFTSGINHVHENSARWVWRCVDDQLYIGNYSYVNGQIEKNDFIKEIEADKTYRLEIKLKQGHYYYLFDSEIIWIEQAGTNTYYKIPLYPYFGGDCTAPKNMKINFKEL